MDIVNSQDNILSFIFGILIVIIFWYSFKPRYIIIKNGNKTNENNKTK